MLTHHSDQLEHPDLDWDVPDFPAHRTPDGFAGEDPGGDTTGLPVEILEPGICIAQARLSHGSGKSYVDYMHDEIIGPVRLANTRFDLSPEQER